MECNNKNCLIPMLDPQSIAILGASANEKSIGGRPVAFLKKYGFRGLIYPINPKYKELQGLPCYESITSLPQATELLIITISANGVLAAVQEAAQKGIKAIVIFTSGFAELGDEGRLIQQKIVEYALGQGIVVAGPNCQGYINHWSNVTATFTGALARNNQFIKGNAALCSQSGAMGGMLYAVAQEMGIGFSYQITTGNEASVTMSDYLEYLLDSKETDVVAAYLETVQNVAGLRRVADLSMRLYKPVVAMKVGRSSVGVQAAVSHTGAMTGEDRVVDAFFRQHGIIRVGSTGEMLDCITAFRTKKQLKGNRVGIVSISGGAGVVMADACEDAGLEVVPLSSNTENTLREMIPIFGSPRNPVDLTAQVLTESDNFYQSLRCVAEDPAVDAVVVFIGLLEHLQDVLIPAVQAVDQLTDKPILVTWLANNVTIRRRFFDNRIPLYDDPTRCIGALAQMDRFRKSLAMYQQRLVEAEGKMRSKQDIRLELLTSDRLTMDELRSKLFLEGAGVSFAREEFVVSLEEAICAAKRIGYPVVLKVVSADLPHKSEVGGVKVNIGDEAELKSSLEQICQSVSSKVPEAKIEGFLVAEMVADGTELFIGIKYDPTFGWVIATGLGGIYIEIFKDVSTRILPITRSDAQTMLRELDGYRLLAGARGKEGRDIEAVVDTIMAVASVAEQCGEHLSEIDINPLIVMDQGSGVKAVDALVVKRSTPSGKGG